MAVVTALVELVPAVPSTVNMASCADEDCVHGFVVDDDTTVDLSELVAPAVDVTPRLDRPASLATLLNDTLIVFEAPVADGRSPSGRPSWPAPPVAGPP